MEVAFEDLTVDHIVCLWNGGRTSRANAVVLCRWCNSSKGARNTFLDFLRGRQRRRRPPGRPICAPGPGLVSRVPLPSRFRGDPWGCRTRPRWASICGRPTRFDVLELP